MDARVCGLLLLSLHRCLRGLRLRVARIDQPCSAVCGQNSVQGPRLRVHIDEYHGGSDVRCRYHYCSKLLRFIQRCFINWIKSVLRELASVQA